MYVLPQILTIILDTSFFKVITPIKVIEVTQNEINYEAIISMAIAVLSIAFIIWDKIKKPIIFGKIVSMTLKSDFKRQFTVDASQKENVSGTACVIKIALSCIRKSLDYKDVKVFVTLNTRRIEGQFFWVYYLEQSIEEDNGKTFLKMLFIPPEKLLNVQSIIEINKVNFYYLMFLLPGLHTTPPQIPDKIEIELVTPNNKSYKIDLLNSDPKQMHSDDHLIKSKEIEIISADQHGRNFKFIDKKPPQD